MPPADVIRLGHPSASIQRTVLWLVAIDGATFRAAFPQSRWIVGDVDLERWKGELDYWVFPDGVVGRVAGSVNGQADGFEPPGVQATIRVTMTARDRGAQIAIPRPR